MTPPTQSLLYEFDAIIGTTKHRVVITISAPYKTLQADWACLFELKGLPSEEECREYFGVDALQSLVLTLFYLKSVFDRLRKQGYRLCDTGVGEDIAPETYFEIFNRAR